MAILTLLSSSLPTLVSHVGQGFPSGLPSGDDLLRVGKINVISFSSIGTVAPGGSGEPTGRRSPLVSRVRRREVVSTELVLHTIYE